MDKILLKYVKTKSLNKKINISTVIFELYQNNCFVIKLILL